MADAHPRPVTISLPALPVSTPLSSRRPVVVNHRYAMARQRRRRWLRTAARRDKGIRLLVGGVSRSSVGRLLRGGKGARLSSKGTSTTAHFRQAQASSSTTSPQVLVINNLEFDHGDIFRDFRRTSNAAFRHLLALVPQGAYVSYNADESSLAAPLLPVRWCECISVVPGEHADLRICGF